MIDIGKLIARQIDRFVMKKIPTYRKDQLLELLEKGTGHTGRLLHYFPFEKKGKEENESNGIMIIQLSQL